MSNEDGQEMGKDSETELDWTFCIIDNTPLNTFLSYYLPPKSQTQCKKKLVN